MTITHLSHFGLTLISETTTNVVLSGSLAACKRMAAAHGMEIEQYEGRIESCKGGHAVYVPVDQSKPNRILFKDGGMIQKCRDDYSLVMPLNVWLAN